MRYAVVCRLAAQHVHKLGLSDSADDGWPHNVLQYNYSVMLGLATMRPVHEPQLLGHESWPVSLLIIAEFQLGYLVIMEQNQYYMKPVRWSSINAK